MGLRCRRYAVRYGRALLVVTVLVALVGRASLQKIATFLTVQDPLEPASAIVVLAGGFPARELEAATLYADGIAPSIILVREQQNQELMRQALGLLTMSHVRRDFLVRHGVPSTAIVVLDGEAVTTLDELEIVAQAIRPSGVPVILVTSGYHTRRTAMAWRYVGQDDLRSIVRGARRDRIPSDRWWWDPIAVRVVIREYIKLLDAVVGFPLTRWVAARGGRV